MSLVCDSFVTDLIFAKVSGKFVKSIPGEMRFRHDIKKEGVNPLEYKELYLFCNIDNTNIKTPKAMLKSNIANQTVSL